MDDARPRPENQAGSEPGDPRLREAQARWRGAGDRIWPVAMVDGATYQRAVHLVGVLLDDLRRRASTLDELLALDADPAPLIAAMPGDGVAAALGERLLADTALGLRGAELVAAAEHDRRAAVIVAARDDGGTWVELERPAPMAELSGMRSVQMHLPSGVALVATADPYAPVPFALEEVALDPRTGAADGSATPAGRERTFADRDEWLAERERWREQVVARLDNADGTVSYER